MAKKEEEIVDIRKAKLQALQAAMSKIEKDFGKGSIMKLGDENTEKVDVIPTGSISLNAALGVEDIQRDASLKFMAQSHREKLRSPFMPLLRHRRQEALPHSSTPNMLSTASMRQSLVLIPTVSSSHSQTMANKLSKLPTS